MIRNICITTVDQGLRSQKNQSPRNPCHPHQPPSWSGPVKSGDLCWLRADIRGAENQGGITRLWARPLGKCGEKHSHLWGSGMTPWPHSARRPLEGASGGILSSQPQGPGSGKLSLRSSGLGGCDRKAPAEAGNPRAGGCRLPQV